VALEFLSIPAYMMAAWKKRDRKSNEAGVKYYLLGVFASAVMLYGMSLLYGVTGSTLLTEIGKEDHPRRRQGRRAGARHRVRHRRLRLQDQCRAVPHSGHPTPTRARPRRSPRSSAWPRRPPASSA
jgi:hypothetical protein